MAICPRCGFNYQPFLDGGIDLQAYYDRRKIPLWANLPFTSEKDMVTPIFRKLAEDLQLIEPVGVWEKSFTQCIKEATLKTVVKAYLTGCTGLKDDERTEKGWKGVK